MNKRWQFIPQDDGTYYIRNKLSEQYWSLNDLSKPAAYNNKLVQRKTPMKWQIEIVSSDNEKLNSVNDYDSRNFAYNGGTVKSTNWMGALPGNLKISDISIPGTHDSGSCNLHDKQDDMSTQRYYIDELLNCGVRHLDLRTGLNGDTVRVVHSSCHARNRSNQDLTLTETIDWIYGFLNANRSETIILQVKVDDGGEECERATFRQLEALAKETNSKIWAGDHVPTLDEVRGKVVIISRLDPGKLQGGDFDIDKDGKTLKWALDCHDWKDSKDLATALTAQGSNFEVWTQDNWNRSANHKKSYVRATLFGNKDDGYTNGTMYRYDRAKEVGKDAWVFNYTSANNGSSENPFNISKEIHQWIYNSSDYSSSDRLVCNDTFTGVMAFDYMDGLMATKIYRTNFDRQYVTIHGVTADGEEPVDPLTLYVGNESESVAKLQSDTTRAAIKAHFNTDPYLVMAVENGEILSTRQAANQEEFNNGVQAFGAAVEQGLVDDDLYVHLEAPIRSVEFEVEMPACNTSVTAEEPHVTVFVDDRETYAPALDDKGNVKAFITEDAEPDDAFTGTVEGGADMPVQIYLAPKWGYRFSDVCTVVSEMTKVESREVTQSGQLKIKATGRILHSVNHVDEVPATCTEDGMKAHYYCETCNKAFFAMEEIGDSIQEEASEEDLRIPAVGHDWGEWEVDKEATESEAGLMIRRCQRDGCDAQESTEIPVSTHVHNCTHVAAKEASDCTETGNIEYWVCDQGDDYCGRYYSDEACKHQITEDQTKTSAGEHNWGQPTYTEVWSGNKLLVIAKRQCANDASHAETEMTYGTVEYQAPTCTEDGYRQASVVFENEAFHYEIEDVVIKALGHEWDASREKVVLESTCSTTGIRVSPCKRCGEIHSEDIRIDSDAHITFTEEDEASNTATCTEGGQLTQREICSLCGKVIETRSIPTEPRGHQWGAPIYEWSDVDSTVTATRVCQFDGCGESESETATGTRTILSRATFEADGMILYDAQFGREAFDTPIVPIPKITGAKLSSASYTYNGTQRKPAVVLTDSNGGNIAASDYSVAYANNTAAGTASATVSLKGDYYEGTKKLTFKIGKASNPLKVKGKTAAVKYSKLKKKAQRLAVTKVIKFTKKGQGKMTYRLSSVKKGGKSFKKYFKINKTTGKLTIKKNQKMKKGTYKVKVKVKAAGNANYNASAAKTVTFKVRVK